MIVNPHTHTHSYNNTLLPHQPKTLSWFNAVILVPQIHSCRAFNPHTHTHKYTTPLQGTVKATTTVCVRVCVQVCGGITTPDWCNPFKMTLISSDSSPAACGAVQDVQTVNQWQSDPLHNFSVRPCNKQQDDRAARENGNNIYLTFSTIFTVIIT